MNPLDAARMIDISAVRTQNNLSDIKAMVELAKEYKFINVHVLPFWVKQLALLLQEVDGVYVGAPVGFPSGACRTDVKIIEAQKLIEDGVEEMDIVMNVGMFRQKEYGYVLDELKQIIGLSGENILTKVIIEINTLTDGEMEKACDLVMQSGADFIKTGTGWIPGGANISRIKRIKKITGKDIKVKAAGGIRTTEEFLELADAGVERFGINADSAIAIVNSFA